MFVPSYEEWDSVKKGLLDGLNSNKPKHNFKRFGNLTVSLLKLPKEEKLRLFDKKLIDKNILLPKKKKEHLHTVYDEKMGLDKWLQED